MSRGRGAAGLSRWALGGEMQGPVPQFLGVYGAIACLAFLSLALGGGVASARRGSSFDASDVRREIHRDLPRIHRCYESALRDEPTLAGKVAVKFAIARRGDVREARVVENTTGNAQVGRCVARVVSKIRFRPRSDGRDLVRFTFPFVFALP
ncbi:MAG: AgmX/PglI C-terminal domain-containing protein [Myxococcota bacterium]